MNTKLKGKWAGKREKRENCACECEVSSRKFYFHKNPAFIDFFSLLFFLLLLPPAFDFFF